VLIHKVTTATAKSKSSDWFFSQLLNL